ncbi:MAG: GDYXXLXY domain-containing protein [Candidatus Omnitrophica bacterium]|nr:GDYXXLXY domain-containing protein [Candidatus Omnitrophota bacterium]
MKIKLIIGLFLFVCLAQIITPLSMIANRELVLKRGTQYKFKVAPVDPYDAFRGRYVALRFEEDYCLYTNRDKLNSGQQVYALINVDERGFAKFSGLAMNRPEKGPYIKTRLNYISGDKAYLDIPIDRYYMEEGAAPRAEKIYQQHSRGGKEDAYAIIRIKDGLAVIESLYVAGDKIEDLVKKE